MHFKISLESARWFSKMVAGRKLISAIPSLMSEWRNTNVQSITHTLDVKRRISLKLFKIFLCFLLCVLPLLFPSVSFLLNICFHQENSSNAFGRNGIFGIPLEENKCPFKPFNTRVFLFLLFHWKTPDIKSIHIQILFVKSAGLECSRIIILIFLFQLCQGSNKTLVTFRNCTN